MNGFNALYDTVVQPGTLRIIWCRICGSVIAVIAADSEVNGDPQKHEEWHRERGETL